ncbi:ABC transporter permease [Hyphomonas sp.]|uniref:ABC transporter permease n=1 Tax=Hyphomonas sp. TaxID=87 RepID=UPI0025BCCCDB|nr:ABC transporter permease [Hyphomonas sp.]
MFRSLIAVGAPFQAILKHHSILARTTWVDIKAAYAGSVLGIVWVIMGPLLMLSVYALTYAVIFKVRIPALSTTEYVLYVFCGIVPFLAFAQSLSAGTLSLSSNRAVMLNTVFPAEMIPLRSVLVGSASMVTGTMILLFSDFMWSKPSPLFLLIPVVMVFQIMFSVGVCWMLSLVALLVRDLAQLIYFITMMLLIITPIAYTPDMIPDGMKTLMLFNPLYYFVTCFQYIIILDRVPPVDTLVIGASVSLAFFIIGYSVFHRSKQVFYDFA